MLAGMVWGQLCKDKTAKHSKQEEISRVQLTMLIEGLTISPALGSPEARDGWYVAMDVDRNCLGGEQSFDDPHALSNWRQSSREE